MTGVRCRGRGVASADAPMDNTAVLTVMRNIAEASENF
jgi:hypothetical protein